MAPRLVWPAPGFPHLVSGDENGLRLLVAHVADADETLRAWATGWRLEGGGRSIGLELVGVARCEPPAEVAGFAALPDHRRLRYAELRLRAEAPLRRPARRSAVYDLVSPRGTERARAVGWFAGGDELHLAFASDVHVAALWDDVAAAVATHAPDLAGQLAHPNANLRRFVDAANRLARAGELDAVVFGGDLVDHVYDRGRAAVTGVFAETNVSRFLAAIAALELPSFVVPGNHDYRLYPWRLRAYGLHAARIPKPRLRALLERAGWWDRWPLRWTDLDALATDDAPRAPLHHHLTHLAPSTDFDVRVGATRLVFLDSGRDLVPRWRTVDRARYPLLLRSLPGSWIDPDSEGLHDRQLAYLREVLTRAESTAVFCHAPLLASPLGPVPERVPSLAAEHFASELGFERHLARRRARTGVLFHNTASTIRLLRESRAPLTWFAGHVHRHGAFAMERGSGALAEVGRSADDVAFLQTASLGLQGARDQDRPGFLLASLRNGRLVAHRSLELQDG